MRSERQNKKLLKLVTEDTLTRVKNRRSFDEKVEELLANYKRVPKPVSMLLLDLDSFKKINDSHGHKQGDHVLIDFAKIVKSRIRETDYIYRFGGEEFVVIAKNSLLEDAGNLADSIRKFVQESEELSKFKVTVSIGVSEIAQMDDADSWFRRADLALYESKSSGRNTVRLAELDENMAVSFRALSRFRNIKLHSANTNSLIRPFQDNYNYSCLIGSNAAVSSSLEQIDTITT
jgi:diguanylate cyclase (GGDEF)-like protein